MSNHKLTGKVAIIASIEPYKVVRFFYPLLASIIFSIPNLYAQTNLFPSSGNTGIGTNSPLNLLHVAGATRISNAGGQSMIYFTHGATYGNTYSEIDALVNSGAGFGNLVLQSSGMVGIGVNNPQAKLDLASQTSIAPGTSLILGFSEGGGIYHGFRQNSAHTLILDSYNGSWNAGWSQTTNGNIGIGTSSPDEKLSVNGNISAKKLIVRQTGWSDYVFDSSYILRPLSEVADFIKMNKRLPDLPSTKEVNEKGINVGDNQALLLKKIEELTLYLIDLKEENRQQGLKITKLENQIKRK